MAKNGWLFKKLRTLIHYINQRLIVINSKSLSYRVWINKLIVFFEMYALKIVRNRIKWMYVLRKDLLFIR